MDIHDYADRQGVSTRTVEHLASRHRISLRGFTAKAIEALDRVFAPWHARQLRKAITQTARDINREYGRFANH